MREDTKLTCAADDGRRAHLQHHEEDGAVQAEVLQDAVRLRGAVEGVAHGQELRDVQLVVACEDEVVEHAVVRRHDFVLHGEGVGEFDGGGASGQRLCARRLRRGRCLFTGVMNVGQDDARGRKKRKSRSR